MTGETAPGRPRGLYIVWLEDDEAFFEHAMALLEAGKDSQEGTPFEPSVHRVSTLRDALAALSQNPSLIVADLNVSDSKGADTLRALRDAAHDTPLLVLTVVNDLESTMVAAMEGAEFLDKDDLNPKRFWRVIYMAIMRANAHATAP